MSYSHRPKCTMCPMLHMCMQSMVCKPNICKPGMLPMYMGQGMYPMSQGMYPMGQDMHNMGMQMPSMGQKMPECNYPTVVSPEYLPGTTPHYANIPMSEHEEYHKTKKKHNKHEKYQYKNHCKNYGHYSSD